MYRYVLNEEDEGFKQYVHQDFPTYYFTTAQSITKEDGKTEQINYLKLIYYGSASSNQYKTVNTDGVYKATLARENYITWETDKPIDISFKHSTSGAAYEYTYIFEYTGNNTEYSKDFLFEYFPNTFKVDFNTIAGYNEHAYNFTDTVTTPSFILDGTLNWLNLWEWTYSYVSKQNVIPTIFLDDNTAVSLFTATHAGTLPQNALLALQAEITSINNGVFSFNTVGYYNSGSKDVGGVIWDISVDLNCGYYRILAAMSDKFGTLTSTGTTAKIFKWLYDSGAKTTILECGTLSPDVASGNINEAHYYNLQGSIAYLTGKFRATINSCGLISNLSYGDEGFIGTLLAEWNSISETDYIYCHDKILGYKSTDGNYYEITVEEGDATISLLFDRYIVINTDGYWNCYDIRRSRPLHYVTRSYNPAIMQL